MNLYCFCLITFIIKLSEEEMMTHSIQTNRPSTIQPSIYSQNQHAFQFPKTKRFPSQNPECPQAFYHIDAQLSNRKAHIGYGQKSDFTKTLTASPPATRYNHKSIFDSHKTGRTFGCSREKSPDRSYLMPQLHQVPGPGQYQNQIKTRMHQSFYLTSKTIDIFEKKASNKYTPGPAAYQTCEYNRTNGKFFNSKYKDTKLATIDPMTKRFSEIKQSPGPSNYEHRDLIADKTKYVLSVHQGRGNRPFDKEARFTFEHWKPSLNPGPGNYEIKSSFDKHKVASTRSRSLYQ